MTDSIKSLLTALLLLTVIVLISGIIGYEYGKQTVQNEALSGAVDSADKAKKKTETILGKQDEGANEAKENIDKARADYVAAVAANDRLRKQIAVLSARTNNPAAAGDCTAAGNTAVLYAKLFEHANERAGELAEYADRARIAGQACERQYDALTNNQEQK